MNIVVNAISAKTGGALTYLQNVLPELKNQLDGKGTHQLTVWRGNTSADDKQWPSGIEYREDSLTSGEITGKANPLRRIYFDQIQLRRRLQFDKSDVLFSSANYGILLCPCYQVLLVRNTIYFDESYLRRMKSLKAKAYLMSQRWLILKCISAADVILFPTQAMVDIVAPYTNGIAKNWCVSPFGARHDWFYPSSEFRDLAESPVRLLHVSGYTDQKNIRTLLTAVKKLQQVQKNRYHLQLTAGFDNKKAVNTIFTPDFQLDQQLYYELHDRGGVEDLQWCNYRSLPDLYRSADIFVFPSYTESFGHPLVEAMASGLPIIASDIPVNREVCGDAAIYCPPFDAVAWAEAIQQVAEDEKLRTRLSTSAILRSKAFTWKRHVADLVSIFNKGVPELSNTIVKKLMVKMESKRT